MPGVALGAQQPHVAIQVLGREAGKLSGKKVPGVLVTRWLNVSQQGAQMANKAHGCLACTRCSVANRTRGVIFSLYSELVSLHLECPSLQEGFELLEHIQRRARKLVKGLENKSCEEQLRELQFARG